MARRDPLIARWAGSYRFVTGFVGARPAGDKTQHHQER